MPKVKDKDIFFFGVYLVIALLGWIIPPIAPITEQGMRLLSLFVAAVVAWSVTSHVWPSLLTLFLLPFTGLTTLTAILSASWGQDLILFMVLLFILSAFLEETKTTQFCVAFFMTRKFLVGHPWRFLFMIFFVAWLLAIFCGSIPGMMIAWSFIYKICNILGYKPYEKFSNLMIFGVAVVGAVGLSSAPWSTNALVILSAFTAQSGQAINALHYLGFGAPVAIFSILGYLLLCKFIFRLDVSSLKALNPNVFDAEDLKLTAERKIALSALGALILLLVVPSLFPAGSTVRMISDNMGMCLKAAGVLAVVSVIKVQGKQVMNFGQLAAKGVPWTMIMMVVSILAFCGFMGSADAGISAFLSQTFAPLFSNVSPITLIILTLVITVVLTNFMVNVIVAVIIMTITLPLAASLGVMPLQMVYLISVGCTIAFFLPPASAASSVLFANTQWIKAKDVYLYAAPTIIMMTLVTLAWNVIYFSIL